MKVLVTGATSMVGDFLLPMLAGRAADVVAVSRGARPSENSVRWMRAELSQPDWFISLGQVDAWVNLAPLGVMARHFERAVHHLQPERILAFSSTSMFTKRYAKHPQDRRFAEELARSEALIRRIAERMNLGWTFFRPTMIYCLGRDKNVSLILRFIRRFGFFPLVGSGRALRQPVWAGDLAEAAVAALSSDRARNKAYNLGGGEVLSYRAMVTRLFERLGRRPHFVYVPIPALRGFLAAVRLLPCYRYLTQDMADRMEIDMAFPHDEATKDLGYSPCAFLEGEAGRRMALC